MTDPSLDAFRAQQHRIAAAIDTLSAATEPLHAPHAEHLTDLAERTRNGTFRVVLLGCFSSGKSTLLNALLGRPVLPVKVNPCTAVLTEVVYAETPAVTIHHTDGTTRDLDIDSFIAEFQLSGDDTTPELDRFSGVDRAVVGWPLDLLKNGVVLVDTPGLDDDPIRTERTLSTLPSADAVLMVLNATRFLTALERQAIASLAALGLNTLFFPIAMADLVDALADDPAAARRDLEARADSHLAGLVGEHSDRIHWVNGRGALRARWVNGAPASGDATATGIPAFERALTTFLVHDRGQARERRIVDAVDSIRLDLRERKALEDATRATSLDDLIQRRVELQPQLDRIHAVAARIERQVSAFVTQQGAEVWEDLRSFLADTERILPTVVAEIDVGNFAGLRLLLPSGREAVEARLRDGLQDWLTERLQRWRDGCVPRINRALTELRDELAGDATEFDTLRADVLDAFTAGHMLDSEPEQGPTTNERWFAVAIGAVLLSPGTVAAGWNQGYEGILKGAAGRLGARIGVVAIGALLGPPGWIGLVVYIVADAVVVLLTGGTQLTRTRERLAAALQGQLVGQVTEQREQIEQHVSDALQPFSDALTQACQNDATALTAQLDAVLLARQTLDDTTVSRDGLWSDLDDALSTTADILS